MIVKSKSKFRLIFPPDRLLWLLKLCLMRMAIYKSSYLTGNDLIESPEMGMWQGREDIQDSTTFVKQLRK